MANLLSFCFFPAFLPPKSGGEVRVFSLYSEISRHHNVTLITSGNLGGKVEYLQHNANFLEIRVPKPDHFVTAWQELEGHSGGGDLSGPCLSKVSSYPDLMHQIYSEKYQDADIIIHEFPFTVGYDLFIGIDNKPRVYNSHNVEFDLYKQLHHESNTSYIADIVRRDEYFLCKNVNLISACSTEDISKFRALYDYDGDFYLTPNGIDRFNIRSDYKIGDRIVFIGSSHRPNQLAAKYIVDRVAPKMPDCFFDIIGSCMEAGTPAANVISHGVVDEEVKRSIYANALACLNPMRDGGGSSLKIADLASHGVPLISTLKGVRGFAMQEGVHYLDFDLSKPIESLRSAISDVKRLALTAQAAANHVRERFTWPDIAAGFSGRLQKLLDGHQCGGLPDTIIALNDYDPFDNVGGGVTRIKGLYEGVSEIFRVLMLTFTEGSEIVRREHRAGSYVSLALPKTEDHRKLDIVNDKEFHVSTADITSSDMVIENTLFCSLFDCTKQFSNITSCEHPYMSPLLKSGDRRFIYSSQNVETTLKKELLAWHPRASELIEKVAALEEFCVSSSDLNIAVADRDARQFAALHRLVAPIIVVPNGADEPSFSENEVRSLPGFNACFLGSAHMPNYTAARFLIEQVAPELPSVTFHVAGSVAESFNTAPPNVKLWGRLDDSDKTRLLSGCQLALNPMSEGSGSNVKMADYLKHGLPVLTTKFGARGYDEVSDRDVICTEIENFVTSIHDLSTQKTNLLQFFDRRKRYINKYSMKDNGRDLGNILKSKINQNKRALYVTYRYNDPPRGGGEIYVNRLIDYLAKAGVDVDVITPMVDLVIDKDRFGSVYERVSDDYPVPTGNPLVRVAKFETQSVPDRKAQLEKTWSFQPSFERAVHELLPITSDQPFLAWGWDAPSATGRWTMCEFGIWAPKPGGWEMSGHCPHPRHLILRDSNDCPLLSANVHGHFDIRFDAPSGYIKCNLFEVAPDRALDPRPLGLYISEIAFQRSSLTMEAARQPSPSSKDPLTLFRAMHQAALTTRFKGGASLAQLRGPFSSRLELYLDSYVHEYDLVITHNSVFRTAFKAVEAAKSAGVPSIVIPHAHFEDDYYHFPDVMASIANASRSLVTPRTACDFLAQIGLQNVDFLSPGIDASEEFSSQDEADFASLYNRDEPFVLVAGRKATAKGYRNVISAVAKLRAGKWPRLRVVMIGPDDDDQAVTEDYVDYLGMVDRSVLRGAYRACSVLANMSDSESFGIVLLEAGLASRPVVANADCAAFIELVSEGKNGYLATQSNLHDRLDAILSDRSLARMMGEHGRAMALEYDWDHIGKLFVRHCYELMSRGES